jgi:hypothetical protein
MNLEQAIKKKKPNISDASMKTYKSILSNLYKKFGDSDSDMNIDFFNNQDSILRSLSTVKPSSRKTILSALVSITDDSNNDKYKKAMMDDISIYKKDNLKQEKTDTQKQNWITQDEIKKVYDDMIKQTKLLWNKQNLSKHEYQKLQDVIILALTTGLYIPPRRSLDWTMFVIKDIDTDNDNYMKRNKFYFNHYKNSNMKGQQIISIPPKLSSLLKKFIKHNTNKYLLNDSYGRQMTSTKLNQHLERIFKKKVGVNILRHSFISNKYPIFNVEELKKDATDMASSVDMMLNTYIKKE